MKNQIQLRFLRVGENFEIPQLCTMMRNLTVLRSSDCGVLVTGEMRDDENCAWRRETNRISAGIMVESTGVINDITINDKGGFSVKNSNGEIVSFESSLKRGKKAKERTFKWPKGKFTIKEVAEKEGLDYQAVMMAFKKEQDQFEKIGTQKIAAKGKPASVWKLK